MRKPIKIKINRYIYHDHGFESCGNKAIEFLPKEDPMIDKPYPASDFRKLNGESCKDGETLICGSCGKPVCGVVIEDIRHDDQCNSWTTRIHNEFS